MALQGSYTSVTGAVYPTAYMKIAQIDCDWLNSRGNVMCLVFIDQQSRNDGYAPLEIIEYPYRSSDFDSVFGVDVISPVDKNPISVAYDDIKTKDRWLGWSDV